MACSRDLYSHLEFRRAISPVSVGDNTAQASQIIDTKGFDSLVFAIATGSLADADATFAVLIEESDDSGMSGATAVSDTQLNGTEAEAGFQYDDDNETRKIGYVGDKRYVQMTITPSGNSGAALISAMAVLGRAHQTPVS